jgi:enoyl-[acyl-carrier protein] reductase I
MGLLSGKKALIFGVANDRSIAWGIARALHAEGCELGFTFLGEALEKRVRPLAESLGSEVILPCDASKDDQIEALYRDLAKAWGKFDILIHSIAFANKDEMAPTFAFRDTSRAGFQLALDVSAYSLLAVTRPAVPLLNPGASILTLSYYGAEKVIPNYNVMGVAKAALEAIVRYLAYDLGSLGIRVNAVSAGPIKTLAASGVGNFKSMLKAAGELTPLRRNVTQEEVGATALFLCSAAASGITGETLYVDAGANIVGMNFDQAKTEEKPAGA